MDDEAPRQTPPAPPAAGPPSAEAGPAPPPALPDLADGVSRPVDPRNVTLGRIVGAIVTLVISSGSLIPVIIFTFVAPVPVWARPLLPLGWLVVAIGLGLASYAWPPVEHRYMSYRLDSRTFEIRRGVLWRKRIAVPRNRIQHMDVSQGPLQRQFDLATLILHTAGTSHAEVTLPGLPHSVAVTIRDLLAQREEDDAV